MKEWTDEKVKGEGPSFPKPRPFGGGGEKYPYGWKYPSVPGGDRGRRNEI